MNTKNTTFAKKDQDSINILYNFGIAQKAASNAYTVKKFGLLGEAEVSLNGQLNV
jgi:hypothetical protein